MSVKDIFIKVGNWQKSSEDLTKKGGLSLKRAVRYMLQKLHVPFIDDCCADYSGTETLVADGAVSTSTQVTLLDTTDGAIDITLADGYQGQVKIISMTVDGGDAVLTPANLAGGTTITFAAVGEWAQLTFVGTEWLMTAGTATLA